jgi:hypothetical protein
VCITCTPRPLRSRERREKILSLHQPCRAGLMRRRAPLSTCATHRSSDLSFGGAANRRKIAVGELECIAAGDHRVAILEFDEAGIHRAVHEDKAELAFPALPVPTIDVRLLAHRAPQIFSIHATVTRKPISPAAAIRISQRSTMPDRLNGRSGPVCSNCDRGTLFSLAVRELGHVLRM